MGYSSYSLVNSYQGETLLSGFDWFNGPDPSNGYVAYQDRASADAKGLFSVDEQSGVVRLGVDSTNVYEGGKGRPSVRLESKETYQHGLFIADFLHMPPSQCGVWPAFWTYGSDWPNGGEIDIIEGANTAHNNLISAHTSQGCTQDGSLGSLYSGFQRNTDCYVGDYNIGCGFDPPVSAYGTYGDGFNAQDGGVYAMLWDDEYIKIWHFARGLIPADIEAREPEPEGWGLPYAIFGGNGCDVDRFFNNMRLVININLCGDYGNALWGKTDTCNYFAETCSEFVGANPEAFESTYWDVRYIDAYALAEGKKDNDKNTDKDKENDNGKDKDEVRDSDKDADKNKDDGKDSDKDADKNNKEDGKDDKDADKDVGKDGDKNDDKNKEDGKDKDVGKDGDGNDDKNKEDGKDKDADKNGDKDKGKDEPVESEQGSSSKRPPPTPEITAGEFVNPVNIDEYAYLGCFACQADSALILQTEADDMNLAKCVEHCRKEGKGAYAGINGHECYCGERIDAEMRKPAPGPCDKPCPGGPDTFCGGTDVEGYKLYTVYGAVQREQQPLPPPMAAPLAQDISHEEYIPKVPDCPPEADPGSSSPHPPAQGDPPASRPEDPERPEGGSRRPVVAVAGAPRGQPPSKLSVLAGFIVMGVMAFV